MIMTGKHLSLTRCTMEASLWGGVPPNTAVINASVEVKPSTLNLKVAVILLAGESEAGLATCECVAEFEDASQHGEALNAAYCCAQAAILQSLGNMLPIGCLQLEFPSRTELVSSAEFSGMSFSDLLNELTAEPSL